MTIKMKAIAAAVLAAGLAGSSAFAADPPPAPAAKKHAKAATKPKPEPAATAAELQELKQQMQQQIDALKNQLSDRDVQLKQAQDAAAAAQASADRAATAASAQQQAVTDNASAVNTLQGTVSDLKLNQTSLATTIQDSQASVKKAIENPDSLHYKGIEITPGGYMAAETIWRSRATGGDIATPFSAIPFEATNAANISEWYSSARQSRVSLMALGKTDWGTLRGYVEADFLGTGVTSNNNQSNSYVLRQRVVWAQAALNNGFAFTGGQLWSLATEDKVGLSNLSGDILTPQTIDPNYNAGFVWTRQYGFRATYSKPKWAIGIAAENPQVLGPGGSINLNSGVAYLWGQPGLARTAVSTMALPAAPPRLPPPAPRPSAGPRPTQAAARWFPRRSPPTRSTRLQTCWPRSPLIQAGVTMKSSASAASSATASSITPRRRLRLAL
jgi:hypothetical protein